MGRLETGPPHCCGRGAVAECCVHLLLPRAFEGHGFRCHDSEYCDPSLHYGFEQVLSPGLHVLVVFIGWVGFVCPRYRDSRFGGGTTEVRTPAGSDVFEPGECGPDAGCGLASHKFYAVTK